MKKRVIALLMAGLLTASLASCVVTGDGGGGTEPNQNITSTTGEDVTPQNPTIVWQDVDQVVYTLDSVKLRAEASTSAQVLQTLPKETELRRVRTSTSWSEVEYNGQKGYVSNVYLTGVDLLGKNFTAVDGGSKTMYANAKVTIRLYPTTEDFSSKIGYFEVNNEVKVVATNDKWSKIEYKVKDETKYYFVNSYYLSASKVTDPNDASQYDSFFTECDPELERYIKGTEKDKVNFRVAPNLNSNLVDTPTKGVLTGGMKVTVLETGTVNEINWSYIEVKFDPANAGDPPTFKYGYVSSSYLAESAGTTVLTLDDLLALYPDAFTKVEKTMYVKNTTSSLTARTSPDLDDDKNIVDYYNTKQAVKVVASGSYNDVNWCVVEAGAGKYYFVGASHLTSDPDGKSVLELSDIPVQYTEFTLCEAEAVKATSVANCYETPTATGQPAKSIAADTTVTVVAKQTGARQNVWWVIQDEAGTLYFVSNALFAPVS